MKNKFNITRKDLEAYKKAQNINSVHNGSNGSRYEIARCKESGLEIEKYLYIADNEDKFFKKGKQNGL